MRKTCLSIGVCAIVSSIAFGSSDSVKSLDFEEISVPEIEVAKNIQATSSSVKVDGKSQKLSYSTIMSTGDYNNGEIFGLVKDYQDKPVKFKDGSLYVCNGTNDGVGSGLDYTSFHNINGKIYMVSQFECQVGALYKVELEQDKRTGKLTPKPNSMEFISQKGEFGGFTHCAGQNTPWSSHLSSEEYEPDARLMQKSADPKTGLTGNKKFDEVAKYWGGDAKRMSPYYYGWTPEVTIDSNGKASYAKHYAMGRMSHEVSYVMPDKKTVYMSDDGTNVGVYMFIADKEGDLSSGTIYAAKWKQTSSKGAGEADLSWINLGHATNEEIRKLIDPDSDVNTNDAIKFSDIFDSVEPNGNVCPSGFTSINASAGRECLKVKSGMEKAASRLETRRYSALKGATTELRKEEGIAFDENSKKLFIAMSAIEKGMEDNRKKGKENTKYDIGGNNDIRVGYNKCGAIYALDVSSVSAKDTDGKVIDSAYVVNNMKSILEGEPKKYDKNSKYANNSCSVDKISNPDNITFLKGTNLLAIGEDTGKHENNMIWTYNVKTGDLTRIGATPVGAEVTATDWTTDLKNGFGYFTYVTQHPDKSTTYKGESTIGYIGAFKGLNK